MKVIALSEIRTENGEYVEQSCIINPEHLVSAHRGLLRKQGLPMTPASKVFKGQVVGPDLFKSEL